jgi:GNAT superfamily N-acetyltransferase
MNDIESNNPQDRNWNVRIAGPGDLDILAHFSALTALETEGVTLDEGNIRAGLATVMDTPDMGCMFIAEDEHQSLGSCLLNGKEFTEWRNGTFYWVTGMYVIPEFRRKGVRFDLYRYSYDWARSQPGVLGLRAYIHKNTNLETMLGDAAGEVHNRPEYQLKPMVSTPYRIIEILF